MGAGGGQTKDSTSFLLASLSLSLLVPLFTDVSFFFLLVRCGTFRWTGWNETTRSLRSIIRVMEKACNARERDMCLRKAMKKLSGGPPFSSFRRCIADYFYSYTQLFIVQRIMRLITAYASLVSHREIIVVRGLSATLHSQGLFYIIKRNRKKRWNFSRRSCKNFVIV